MPNYPLPPVNYSHQYPSVVALEQRLAANRPTDQVDRRIPPPNLFEASAYRDAVQSSIEIPGLYTEVDRLDQGNYYPAAQSYAPKKPGQLFRYKTRQTIALTDDGNLVVDLPVSEKVLNTVKNPESINCTHLRYSAVVSNPDNFYANGYRLRQSFSEEGCEIFAVVTMYNENQDLFLKTWNALQANLKYLCSKEDSSVWGKNGWKKVCVAIISDGRSKINQKTLAVLGLLGIYQEGLVTTAIGDQEVSAHLFEYTTRVCLDGKYNLKKSTNIPPLQVIFCLKEHNAKKINSHRWYFNAFCSQLKPRVCVLIDVGTKPSEKSFYYLWKEFFVDQSVAGACGEIYIDAGFLSSKLISPLVAAQNFEYKMSNILDKRFESSLGFIAVLPGAFSAYRYSALLPDNPLHKGPLDKYFEGELMNEKSSIIKANMYLAEDRILCFELVAKKGSSFLLRYVENARAETDCPDTIPEYISQRRRWLNGSFFAGLHAITHFYQVLFTSHTIGRKMLILGLIFFNSIVLIFNWLAIGCFFLTFYLLNEGVIHSLTKDPFLGSGPTVIFFLTVLYLHSIIMVFLSSLGNRPQSANVMYTFSFFLFALIFLCMSYVSAFYIKIAIDNATSNNREQSVFLLLISDPAFRDIILAGTGTFGVFWVASIIALDVSHMINSFLQYLVMIPSFVNILQVYSFCNLHDISWGTKGDNTAKSDASVQVSVNESGKQVATIHLPTDQKDIDDTYKIFFDTLAVYERPVGFTKTQDDYFRIFRTRLVLFWIFTNIMLVFLFTSPALSSLVKIDIQYGFNPFLSVFLWSICAMNVIKFVGCVVYRIERTKLSMFED